MLHAVVVEVDEASQRGLLIDYLKPLGRYSGRAFETYGVNDPYSITGDDLVAVTMLSIEINRGTCSGLTPDDALALEARSSEVDALLRSIPIDRTLEDLDRTEFDRWLGPGSPGDRLYALIKSVTGGRRVARHKLIARKRPGLLPIRDSVLETTLRWQNESEWWRPWWTALGSDPEVVDRLRRLRTDVPQAQHLSLLRVADIAIWMEHH